MIELYTVATANGQRASIMLEEVGEEYSVRTIDLYAGEHLAEEFTSINPVGRLPLIRDQFEIEDKPVDVYGTLAIALYLAEKHGKLLPADSAQRAAVYQWAGMIVSDLNPALSGQFYLTVLAEEKHEPTIRLFEQTSHRMLKVLDDELAKRSYIASDDFSIADVLAYPSAATSAARLEGGLLPYENIQRWVDDVARRPAVQKGMNVPAT